MWEHNCTSNPAPAYGEQRDAPNAAQRLGSQQCVWVPARLPPDMGKITPAHAGRTLPVEQRSLLGHRHQYQGPSLSCFRKVI